MAYIGKSPTGTGVRQRYYFTATGGETTLGASADDNGLTLSYSDGAYVDVLLNGIELVAGTDYNTTTANRISGLASLSASDVVTVTVYDIFTVADTVSAKDGGTFSGNVVFNGNTTGIDLNGTDLILDADGDSKIEASTDDTINIISGGTTGLTIDSSGRVFKPATPAFHAYASDNAYQTTSPIPFDTTLIDVGSGFDTTNNKYVVPVTGNYYIAVHVGTIRSNVNGEYLTILLKKGTTTIQQGYTEETSSQGYGNVAFSAIHPLTAGDELTVTTSGNGDYYASKTYTIFSGYLIG